MNSTLPNGDVSVAVLAGHLQPTDQAIHPRIGKQVNMGDTGLYFHILPEVAAQWIEVLTPIAEAVGHASAPDS